MLINRLPALGFFSENLSDKSVKWFQDKSSKCPKAVRYGCNFAIQLTIASVTPLVMLVDLIAMTVFTIWACTNPLRNKELNNRGWQCFAAGTYGGILLIVLISIRSIVPITI